MSILSGQEQKALVQVARSAIEQLLGCPEADGPDGGLPELRAGAFVTLHREGQLRGCIGTFDTTRRAVDQVREMALAAATRDPRFRPLSRQELPTVDIEISLLTPPRRIDSVEEIRIGQHGLIISQGARRGVLLPQVALEHDWDRTTFLQQTCRKAGLPLDAWDQRETDIQVFTAEVFGEEQSPKGS